MPVYNPPLRDMQFVMHEVLDLPAAFKQLPRPGAIAPGGDQTVEGKTTSNCPAPPVRCLACNHPEKSAMGTRPLQPGHFGAEEPTAVDPATLAT